MEEQVYNIHICNAGRFQTHCKLPRSDSTDDGPVTSVKWVGSWLLSRAFCASCKLVINSDTRSSSRWLSDFGCCESANTCKLTIGVHVNNSSFLWCYGTVTLHKFVSLPVLLFFKPLVFSKGLKNNNTGSDTQIYIESQCRSIRENNHHQRPAI